VVRANYAKPLRIEDLAKIAGMGVSTLHHHFRTLTAMSPLQYQSNFGCMQRGNACSWIVWTPPVRPLRVGYESATQFNREYSRFFGQPPKRDIRTLRSPGAAPLESVSNQ